MRTDLPFIVHEFKVYVRNMSDIELHQEIVGQWNATRDFDEDEMNIMIEELDRRAKAQEALDRMVAENQRLGLYDDAINMTQERVDETAKDRHEPSDYDKSIHSNPDAQAWAKFFMATVKEQEWCIDDIDEDLMLGWFANAMMAMHDHVKHEWVGLTDEERGMVVNANFGIGVWEMARAIEAKLREKNS